MGEFDYPHAKSPGEILKDIRTSKGIKLETIHEETKIPLDVLRAIEEGYTVRTISPFYMKGFAKKFAQYLGVDIAKIQPLKPAIEPSSPTIAVKASEPLSVKKPALAPIVPSREMTFRKANRAEVFSREKQKLLVQWIGILFLLFIAVRVLGFIFRKAPGKEAVPRAEEQKAPVVRPRPRTTEPSAASPSLQKQTERTPQSKPQAVVPQPKPKLVEPAPKVETKKLLFRLTVKARQRGWLQVKTDGNLVFQSIIQAGMAESWTAENSIEISGKSIHTLEYQLDGKDLGALNTTDTSARRIVVTQEGISIKK